LPSGIIPDLKSCLDASPEEFAKTIFNMDYHIQAAMYVDGLKANNIDAKVFVFVAVEKEPPFAVGVYVLDNDYIEIGRQQYKKALQILAQCIKDNKYPAYSEDIVELKPPRWAFTKRDNEEFVV
jgi:exodeoxyribonuclease VIII